MWCELGEGSHLRATIALADTAFPNDSVSFVYCIQQQQHHHQWARQEEAHAVTGPCYVSHLIPPVTFFDAVTMI